MKKEPPADLRPHLAEGEAGLFLAETLAMLLVDKGLVDLDSLIAGVENAIAAKRRIAENGEIPALSQEAAGVLANITNSISAIDERSRR